MSKEAKIPEFTQGACFGTHDPNHEGCKKCSCYVCDLCKEQTATTAKKAQKKTAVDFHQDFINRLAERLPKLEVTNYPIGSEHKFSDANGKTKVVIRTMSSNMAMLIKVGAEPILEFKPLTTDKEVDVVAQKVESAIGLE